MPRDILELASSLAYLDEIHEQYAHQPDGVDASWHPLLADGGAEAGNGVRAARPAGGGGNGHRAAA
ncbi:MAG TPA: hypothetical protein VK932_23850, partial [Kofleriaceae bacterium]|nr:hypothetical protein [Kofleriaceae bacterium]